MAEGGLSLITNQISIQYKRTNIHGMKRCGVATEWREQRKWEFKPVKEKLIRSQNQRACPTEQPQQRIHFDSGVAASAQPWLCHDHVGYFAVWGQTILPAEKTKQATVTLEKPKLAVRKKRK